jgi:hypothetical protein
MQNGTFASYLGPLFSLLELAYIIAVHSIVSFLAQSIVIAVFICHSNHTIGQHVHWSGSVFGCLPCCSGKEAGSQCHCGGPTCSWAPLSAAPPPPAPLARNLVSLFGMATGAASLSIAAPSATVAVATTAAPHLPAVRCAAQPDDLVPRKFPGEKGIMCPNMIPFVLVIFSIMDTIRPHIEVGNRNSRATAKQKELFQCFFPRTDGLGQQFELWEGDNGWKRFKKAVMCAVLGYAKAHE